METLKQYEFNLAEKLQVYTGMALGTLAPIALVRYAALNSLEGTPAKEAIAWTVSALAGSPLAIIGGLAGTFVGMVPASKQRTSRLIKENRSKKLEEMAK